MRMELAPNRPKLAGFAGVVEVADPSDSFPPGDATALAANARDRNPPNGLGVTFSATLVSVFSAAGLGLGSAAFRAPGDATALAANARDRNPPNGLGVTFSATFVSVFSATGLAFGPALSFAPVFSPLTTATESIGRFN